MAKVELSLAAANASDNVYVSQDGQNAQFVNIVEAEGEKMTVGGDDYQLKVTVAAMKTLLGQLYSIVYTLAKMTPDEVLIIHNGLKEGLQNHPLVHSSDPAISDVASDDVAREMGRILDGVEKQLAQARKKAQEEPS